MSKKEIKETNKKLQVKEASGLSVFTESGLDSGFEDTCSDSFKTPFVRILQTNSPEVLIKGEKYVKGAVGGMFFNTATGKLYDTLNIVVLKCVHNLIEWKPDRGGFVAVHDKMNEQKITARREGLKKFSVAGNDLDDTLSFYCVNHDNPADIFIISVSKTGLKHGRSFATRLKSLTIDGRPISKSWAGVWKISSGMESNDKGSWYTIGTPEFKEFVDSPFIQGVIKPALEMFKTAKVDYSLLNMDEINVVDDGDEVKF